jgi:hypothetical protein
MVDILNLFKASDTAAEDQKVILRCCRKVW